jgi:predicted PurR-regulated permease PerM
MSESNHRVTQQEQVTVQSRGSEFVWKQVTFYLLTLAVLGLCGLLLYPFLSAILGAVVLAVIMQRPHEWLAKRMNRNLSATLMLIVVVALIIVPSLFVAETLGKQVLSLAAVLGKQSTQDKIADFINNHPRIMGQLQSMTDGMDMSQTVRSGAVFLGTKAAGLLGYSILTITQIVVMLVLLFFLFRDCDQALSFARMLVPLRREETDDLLIRCTDTIYATVLGRFVVAGVQGMLSGLAYWVFGVPAPALWAVLTLLMAMIPAFGAVIVWAPVAVYLGVTGHWGRAALLAIWGGGVVSLIDNILYPILVGTRIRHHTATILLSILGGVALFGPRGIILGPLIFTVAGALLEFWRRRENAADDI